MTWFLILYAVEGTVRKYLISTKLFVLFKYLVIVLFLRKVLSNKVYPPVFGNLALLMLLTLPQAVSDAPALIQEVISVFLMPTIVLMLLIQPKPISQPTACINFLQAVTLIAALNSIVVILQHYCGPSHWLNQSVVGEIDSHTFAGGLVHKARGIFANPNGLFMSAGISSILSLSSIRTKQYFPSRGSAYAYLIAFILIVCSALINIVSRSYSFAIFITLALALAFCPLSFKLLFKPIRNQYVFLAVIFILGFAAFNSVELIGSSNSIVYGYQRVAGADSVLDRILGRYGFLNLPNWSYDLLPLQYGAGFGSTLSTFSQGSNLFDAFCPILVREFEFTRQVCSLGIVPGLLVIFLARLLPGLTALWLAYRNRHMCPLLVLPLITIGYSFITASAFRANDVISSTIVLALCYASAKVLLKAQALFFNSYGSIT